MKLAYNPSDKPALTGVSSDNKDIIFDLSGIAIYARGVKFDGKTPTVFKKHTSANTGGYDGLVPAPSYADSATRFLREDGTWVIPDKTTSIHWDNIDGKPDVFNPSQHIHTTNDIQSLTNYTKAIELKALTTSDTLNVALGKLEYKSDLGVTAYNWYKSVTDEDTDEHINKWNEIVDFLNGVTDTTLNGILNNFVNDLEVTGSGNAVTNVSKSNNKITVTKGNSFLPLSGGTLYNGVDNAPLTIKGTTTDAYVNFTLNNDKYLGAIGINKTLGLVLWDVANLQNRVIIHSGNIGGQSVASADKLTNNNAYTIWGQTFFENGVPKNVSGYAMGLGGYIDFQFSDEINRYGGNLYLQHRGDGSQSGTGGSATGNVVMCKNGGNVLIGTSTDSGYKLDVSGKIRSTSEIWGNLLYFTSAGEEKGWFGSPNNAGSNDFVLSVNSGNFRINTSNTEQMRITSSGNVGIGTTSPQYKLDVNGSLRCDAIVTGGSSIVSLLNISRVYASTDYIHLYVTGGTNNARPLVLQNGYGNVGIGTDNPQHKLEVNGDINAKCVTIGTQGLGYVTRNTLILNPPLHTGGPFYIKNRDTNYNAYLDTTYGGTTLLTLIHNGNFGIGTTDPSYKLDVNGAARASGFIKSGSSSAYVLTGDGGHKAISDFATAGSLGNYLPLAGGTMNLGEGLKFHADENYFGTNLDARIISLLDGNGTTCDGGLIIDERATLNGTEHVTELLRIRDAEFKWRGLDILHSGNYTNYTVTKTGTGASGTWGISISGNAATATNARYVIADNNAKDPGHALLQSGSGRTDSSPSGDTWIYYDSLGGTSSPWGIKHEQASNLISFYGSGTRRAYIDLSNGNISCSTINGYTPITSGNIGAQSVNYASSAGSTGSCTGNANGLASTGYGNGNLTYYQTDGSFFGNSGWSHYIIANHGNGSSYYNYTIALPFWGVPKYKRLKGGAEDGWHTFITSENYTSYTDGRYAWGNYASQSLSDCNSVSSTGFWTHSGFANRPSDVSNWGSLMNIRLYGSNNLYHRQLFFDCYGTDRIWTRSDDGGTWTSWKLIAFTNGYHIAVTTSAGTDASTIYFVI